jgi:hypothetical protein
VIRRFRVGDTFDAFVWLYTIAEAPPRIAAVGAGRNPRPQ